MLSKASVNHNSHLELNKEMRFDEVKYIHVKKNLCSNTFINFHYMFNIIFHESLGFIIILLTKIWVIFLNKVKQIAKSRK